VVQILLFKPGWRSGYRAGLEIQNGIKVGKPASGPLARRGSNPFPGAAFAIWKLTPWAATALSGNTISVRLHSLQTKGFSVDPSVLPLVAFCYEDI
jgi:hypothetical protein